MRKLMSALTVPVTVAAMLVVATAAAHAEGNGVGAQPALGWSSWSFIRHNPTAADIEATADAMVSSGLAAVGYQYVNVDDFWYVCPGSQGPDVDQYGRWVTDTSKFPAGPDGENGIKIAADYVHSKGLLFGLYVTPGISKQAVAQNTAIEGTPYHADDIATTTDEKNYNCKGMVGIDYSKPGAQEFVDSWAKEFASWGVDYVKIDGVGTPDIPDVQAWSDALKNTGRPIHLELSNSLDISNAPTWAKLANGWRTGGDVECYCGRGGASYPLTDWSHVSSRFNQVASWQPYGGPGAFNDYDSIEVGNGANDGLTMDERKTQLSLWALASSPFILGTDLTDLDPADLALFSSTGPAAAFGQAAGTLGIRAAGADVFGATNQYGAIYLPNAEQDGTTETVKLTAQAGTSDWAKAGVMVRNHIAQSGTSPGFVILAASPGHGYVLQWDADGDGQLDSNSAPSGQGTGTTVYPSWLKLTRSGTTFTGFYSTDDKTWTQIGSADVPSAAGSQDAGVFSTAHASTVGESDFADLSIGPPSGLIDAPGTAVTLPGQPGTVRATFYDHGAAPVSNLAVTLTAPDGWTVSPAGPVPLGTVATSAGVSWQVTAPAEAQPGPVPLHLVATYDDGERSATSQADVPAVVPSTDLSSVYNNVGTTDDTNTGAGNFDGAGSSLSAQALAAVGVTPGSALAHSGMQFAWPDVPSGQPDNVAAAGQSLQLSGTGANLGFLAQNAVVKGSVFTDISGNGLEIGGVDMPLPATRADHTSNVRVSDNHLYSLPVEYLGGVAIDVGYAERTLITHNQIDHTAYTAISLGWGGWPDKIDVEATPNYSNNNTVSGNVIDHAMQVLADGGGIYTQGITGTSLDDGEHLTGNVITNTLDNGHALYCDNGCTYWTASDNVLVGNVSNDWGARHTDYRPGHTGQDPLTVSDNYWWQGDGDSSSNNTTVSGNHVIASVADAPPSIVDSAGLEPRYRHILAAHFGMGVPDAPTQAAAFAANGTAYVAWNPTFVDNGGPVTSYTVTASPGGQRATISAADFARLGYVAVAGLTDGTAYTFTVTARNGRGPSAPSLPTPSITPTAVATSATDLRWPSVAAGVSDNVTAGGQTIAASGASGSVLGLLMTGTHGPAAGSGQIRYADGTTQPFSLSAPDWYATPPSGSNVAFTMTYRNRPGDVQQTHQVTMSYAGIDLDPGKQVSAVVLPDISTPTSSSAALHVFAMTIGTTPLDLSAAYDNVGITDDTDTGAGNIDGSGSSLSAQALAASGVTPGSTVSSSAPTAGAPTSVSAHPGRTPSRSPPTTPPDRAGRPPSARRRTP